MMIPVESTGSPFAEGRSYSFTFNINGEEITVVQKSEVPLTWEEIIRTSNDSYALASRSQDPAPVLTGLVDGDPVLAVF
jgi:hypothetical protein